MARPMSLMIEGWMPSVGSSSTRSLRPRHQRAADRELLLLAAREIAAAPAAACCLSTGKQSRRRRRGCCARPRVERRKAGLEVLLAPSAAGRSRGPAARRRCRAAARSIGRRARVSPSPSHRMRRARRMLLADDGAQQRGLADAVAAEHAGDLARSRRSSGHAAQRLRGAVVQVDVLDGQHRHRPEIDFDDALVRR